MAQSAVEDEKSYSNNHSLSRPMNTDPEIQPEPGQVDTSRDGYVDPKLEKVVLRKLDKRIPLLLAALYLLSFLDRSNIGNARIAGMEEDLELDGSRYSWLLTIFYISYTLFQFLILAWKAIPPHYCAAFTAFAWGTVATCQAAVQSWAGEMTLRFILGAAEAGFASGSIFFLSFFYRRHELGLRCGLFLAAAPLANTFAGALAYGITSGHPKFASWRLLFLVEGLPTVLMTPIAFYFLPDNPTSARFLNKEEKEVAKARALRQVGQVERTGSIHWSDISATLLDAKAWISALMYFSCNVSFSSLPVFLPTVVKDMGFTAIHAQGLTAPPYFLSFAMAIGTAAVADRNQQRGFMVTALSAVGTIGYLLLATCTAVAARYVGVFLAASGVFPAIANILPWVLNNQGSDTRRGMGLVILNLIGQCGPFLGINVFPDSDSPRYIKGQSICAAFMAFNCFLALSLRTLLVWENRKLDEKYGCGQPRDDNDDDDDGGGRQGAAEPAIAEENYGPSYRYVL